MKYKCWFEESCMTQNDCFIKLSGLLRPMQPCVSKGSAVIVFVETKWLSEHALKSFGAHIPDEVLNKQSEWRLRYNRGGRFDFPQIACQVRDSIQFVEGRNRAIMAHELGIKTIPVMAPKDDIGRLFEHILDDAGYLNFDFTDVRLKFQNIIITINKNGMLQTI